MQQAKLLFIYNPKSGQEKIRTKMVGILDVFARAGYTITVHPTQYQGDAMDCIIKYGEDYDRIVISGGDGTLDEAVNGVLKLGKDIPLGYIPAGSTNDFAKTLGISSNMVKAAETAMTGKPFSVDVGLFGERIFNYIAAFGLLTEVSYETDQKVKNVFGHGAYVLEGMRYLSIKDIVPYDMTIATKDQIIKDRFIYGMISNTLSIGGMKARMTDKIKLDDGKFEALFIKYPEDTLDLNATLASLLSQDPNPDYMYFFKDSQFQIISAEPVAWTLDGEEGGSHTEVSVKNLKQAVSIIVP